MARNTRGSGVGSAAGRVAAGLAALVVLAAALVGLPYLLVKVAGSPLPTELPALDTLRALVTGPDSGTLFVGALKIVAWLAWATFVLSVLVEIPAQLRRRRTIRLPGFGLQQRLAAVLVGAVLAVLMSPAVSSASARGPVGPPVAQAAPVAAAVAVAAPNHLAQPFAAQPFAAQPFAAPPVAAPVDLMTAVPKAVHQVRSGESLLSVAEEHGVGWESLARANYGRTQPDGRALQPGEQRVYPGWTLVVPGAESQVSALMVYEIVGGDWLGCIAERYLGDFDRYPEIAQLNRHLIDDPDHIEPGWRLTLPRDAVDRGTQEHATGAVEGAPAPNAAVPGQPGQPGGTVAPPAPGGGVPPPVPAPTAGPAVTPTPTASAASPSPTPSASAGPSPTPSASASASASPSASAAPSAGPSPTGAPHAGGSASAPLDGDITEDSAMEKVSIAFGAASLLAALAFGAVLVRRRGQRQHHTPGRRPANPAGGRIETELRVAQQPLNVERLDAAMRSLARSLAARWENLPDPVAVVVDRGDVQLLLAAACPNPPAPWQDFGDSWVLPAAAYLPETPEQIAPLPSLSAVGSARDTHLLLDLERIGFLIVTGEPEARADLIRYLASELALNAWSDDVEVTLAGLPTADAELLVALNPDRVRATSSVVDAAARIARRVAAARTTLQHADVPDALAGRISDVAADAWMPQVLVVAEPDERGLAALQDLVGALDGAVRCGVGVVVTLPPEAPTFGRWTITVNADGTLRLPFPLPYPLLTSARLPRHELARLAEIMSSARGQTEVPVPPAPEPEPWAAGTDAAGSMLGMFEGTPAGEFDDDTVDGIFPPADPNQTEDTLRPNRVIVTAAIPAEEPRPRVITAAIRQRKRQSDPQLDADLRAWREQDPGVPRIGILGPVEVAAPGPAPEQRQRFHAEIIVYLAQRGARGADRDRLDEALWPDREVKDASRRVAITRARRWLGEAADGEQWLPDMGADRSYRLRPGFLLDWHLFRRLRTRGEAHGSAGGKDLRTALELVRGVPLDGADRPYAAGARNPYTWLAESDINPEHITAALVDTAHQLAGLCLDADDTAGARWAVGQAWLADPNRGYDQPWRDLMACQHRDGHGAELRTTFAELMRVRDAEVPEDLDPITFQFVLELLPDLVRAAAR